MADYRTNRQAANSTARFLDASGMDWGDLCSTHAYDGFEVVKVFNATSGSGHCYSKGGPAEWLTVIDGKVEGLSPTKRRAILIGECIVNGDFEKGSDTEMSLDRHLMGMAVWNYSGPAPTELQQREINALLKD